MCEGRGVEVRKRTFIVFPHYCSVGDLEYVVVVAKDDEEEEEWEDEI